MISYEIRISIFCKIKYLKYNTNLLNMNISITSIFLSSRLYCRFWIYTRSATDNIASRSRTCRLIAKHFTAGRELRPAPKDKIDFSIFNLIVA